MTISSAAPPSAVIPSAAVCESDSSGFAAELVSARDREAAPAAPPATHATAGSPRSAKSARPKEQNRSDLTASVPVPVPGGLAVPIRILPFFGMTGDGEQDEQEASKGAHAPAPAAPNAAAPNNPPSGAPGEMAFAARVQPASADSSATPAPARALQPETAAAAQVAAKKSAESDAATVTTVQPIAAGAGASMNAYSHASTGPESTPPAAAAAPAPAAAHAQPVEAAWVPKTDSKPAATPLKDISLQVAQPGAQRVEIRVVQQAGELRVAVRTGDTDLSQGLQQGLSDLVGRLQQSGYHAEAWRPSGAALPASPVFESRNGQGASQQGDSQSHSGSPQQDGGRRQNQSRPGWVEELEKSGGGNEKIQGVSYGIGS